MKTLRRLYRYIRPYRGWTALALVSMFIMATSQGALVAITQPLFDELLTRQRGPAPQTEPAARKPRAIDHLLNRDRPEGQRGPLVNVIDATTRPARQWWDAHSHDRWKYLPYLLLLIFLVRGASTFFAHYAFQRVGLSTVRDLRNELYDKVIQQSHRFFSQRPTGEIISRVVSDADQIQSAISIRLGDLFQESLTLIVLAAYVFLVNTELAFITFIIAPIIVLPVVQFGKRLRRTSFSSQERMADVATLLEETIRGVRIVKAFSMERFEMERFHRATRNHLDATLRSQRVQASSSPVMELLAGLCTVLLLAYAGYRIQSGGLSQGQLISFILALSLMYQPIKRLNNVNLAMNSAISAADRVFMMLDVHNEVTDLPSAVELKGIGDGIRYETVGFTYGGEPVLKDIDLHIAPGEIVALVGGSGAGKTTLANLLPRFYDVSQGRVLVDGRDIREVSLQSLRNMIAVVTQEVVLFNDSVRNNIAYGRTDIPVERVVEAAKAAHADDFIRALPGGYDAMVGEAGVLLSGGQRQRLAIARAILKNSPILILDEATSALDAESERLVQEALANLMKGRTTLVIAHRLSTIRRADKIVVLEGGAIREIGRHDELLEKRGLYRRLYDLQVLEHDNSREALA